MQLLLIPMLAMIYGCTMFSSWKSIPPPGGCDQCHTLPIATDWQLAFKTAVLTDEKRKGEAFQTEQYTMAQTSKPSSALDLRKMEEQKCFECHKAPNNAHKERLGRFHH
jgi:hypothetical protein